MTATPAARGSTAFSTGLVRAEAVGKQIDPSSLQRLPKPRAPIGRAWAVAEGDGEKAVSPRVLLRPDGFPNGDKRRAREALGRNRASYGPRCSIEKAALLRRVRWAR